MSDPNLFKIRNFMVMIIVILTAVSGCQRTREAPAALPEYQNIIFFTIDTLNPHYLGCYGDPETRAPVIDRLAARGVLFSDCHTAINLTGPSFSTLNTGVPPYEHQVYDNSIPIANEHTTVAEAFKAGGFNTMAAVSAFHLNPEHSNFGQGFDQFHRCTEIQIDASVTTDRVLEWLTETMNRKRFTWIHYMDCHAVYLPPEPFLGMYFKWDPPRPKMTEVLKKTGTKGRGGRSHLPPVKPRDRPVNELAQKPFLTRKPFSEWYAPWLVQVHSVEDAVAHYRGTITEVNYQMERVCRKISEIGEMDKTLIVVTSDHGESFGEHDIYFDHWGPYEPSFDIPLIFNGNLKPQINTSISGSIDIPPTLLTLAGLTPPESYRGYSLKDAVLNHHPSPRTNLVTEHTNRVAVTIRDSENKMIIPLAPEHFYPNRKELYRYQDDLSEKQNIFSESDEIQKKLDNEIAAYFRALTPVPAENVSSEVAPEVRKQLERLGYFQ